MSLVLFKFQAGIMYFKIACSICSGVARGGDRWTTGVKNDHFWDANILNILEIVG